MIWHWFLTVTGAINEQDAWYGWWSGFGSDLGEFAILGAVIAALRKHNCHVKGCWRIQRHAVEGTPYVVCAKHHPTVPNSGITHGSVIRAHREAK